MAHLKDNIIFWHFENNNYQECNNNLDLCDQVYVHVTSISWSDSLDHTLLVGQTHCTTVTLRF